MKKIWPFSFYLLYFAAAASFLPYVVLYYQSLGFSGAQIGLLTAISPLITLLGAPFWTGFADATHHHKMVMGFTIFAAAVCASIFPLSRTIISVLFLVSLFSFAVAPINSLADAATMSMLADEKQMYGRVRLGGTIGWGVAAPLAGILIENNGLPWAFWTYATIMLIGLFVSQRFIFSHTTHQISFQHGLRILFTNRHLVLFLATSFVCGMAFTSVNVYLFAYMEQLGISKSLMGFALTIATISELPVLFFSDRLLLRFRPHGLLVVAIIATCVRLFLYAIFNSPLGILAFQIINGLTFPALWVAGVSYANENAPAGLSATAQGIFGAMVFGFGAAGGGLLGGLLIESVGGVQMYIIFGVIMFATLITYTLLERRLPPHKNG